MAQDLTSQIDHASEERANKVSKKAGREEDKGALADTSETLKADLKYLGDLDVECRAKSSDFAQRQDLRAGEIDAIAKAVEVMAGSAVGGGSQHLPALVQTKKTSLAQL